MLIYWKNLHTKGPRLVGGGGKETTNCDWINIKFRWSFYPSEEMFQKIHGESLDRGQVGQEPIEKKTKK